MDREEMGIDMCGLWEYWGDGVGVYFCHSLTG